MIHVQVQEKTVTVTAGRLTDLGPLALILADVREPRPPVTGLEQLPARALRLYADVWAAVAGRLDEMHYPPSLWPTDKTVYGYLSCLARLLAAALDGDSEALGTCSEPEYALPAVDVVLGAAVYWAVTSPGRFRRLANGLGYAARLPLDMLLRGHDRYLALYTAASGSIVAHPVVDFYTSRIPAYLLGDALDSAGLSEEWREALRLAARITELGGTVMGYVGRRDAAGWAEKILALARDYAGSPAPVLDAVSKVMVVTTFGVSDTWAGRVVEELAARPAKELSVLARYPFFLEAVGTRAAMNELLPPETVKLLSAGDTGRAVAEALSRPRPAATLLYKVTRTADLPASRVQLLEYASALSAAVYMPYRAAGGRAVDPSVSARYSLELDRQDSVYRGLVEMLDRLAAELNYPGIDRVVAVVPGTAGAELKVYASLRMAPFYAQHLVLWLGNGYRYTLVNGFSGTLEYLAGETTMNGTSHDVDFDGLLGSMVIGTDAALYIRGLPARDSLRFLRVFDGIAVDVEGRGPCYARLPKARRVYAFDDLVYRPLPAGLLPTVPSGHYMTRLLMSLYRHYYLVH